MDIYVIQVSKDNTEHLITLYIGVVYILGMAPN